MQFRTTVLAARQTATGLPVRDDVVGGQDLVPLAAVDGAATAATRDRRVEAVLAALRG